MYICTENPLKNNLKNNLKLMNKVGGKFRTTRPDKIR